MQSGTRWWALTEGDYSSEEEDDDEENGTDADADACDVKSWCIGSSGTYCSALSQVTWCIFVFMLSIWK